VQVLLGGFALLTIVTVPGVLALVLSTLPVAAWCTEFTAVVVQAVPFLPIGAWASATVGVLVPERAFTGLLPRSLAGRAVVVDRAGDHRVEGPHRAVGGVVGLLAWQQVTSGPFAVWCDHAAVEVGAVPQHGHALAVLGQTGASPGMSVRGGARHRSGRCDDEPGVRVHDDPHVRREAVVTAGRSRLAVADRDQGAVHDPQPVSRIGRADGRLEREQRAELPHGQVRAVVHGHDQYPLGRRQTPWPASQRAFPPRSRTTAAPARPGAFREAPTSKVAACLFDPRKAKRSDRFDDHESQEHLRPGSPT
jgi:hypothetical protein